MKPVIRMVLVILMCSTSLFGNWAEAQKIITQGSQNARFGYSIAVTGTYAAVGAPKENGGAGAVYLFKQDANNTWSLFQTIENVSISDEGSSFTWYEYETLGWDVALAENTSFTNSATLVIGAPQSKKVHQIIIMQGTNTEFTPQSGTLIYRLNAQESAFEFVKDYRGEDHNDTGLAVDVAEAVVIVDTHQSGELTLPVFDVLTMVVAGHPNDENVSTYINRVGTDEWREIALVHSGSGDRFGESLAIDSDMSHLIVGAPYRDIGEYPDKGSAYFYKLSGTWANNDLAWSNERTVAQSTSGILLSSCRFSHDSHFGIAVDIRSDKAIVGAEKSAVECRPLALSPYVASGAAYAYALSDTALNDWSALGAPFRGSSVDSENDGFGRSVAIAGDRALVGAPFFTGSKQSGAAFLYDYDGSTWNETQAVVAETDGTLGSDVAIDATQLFIADEENDELSVYEYQKPLDAGISSALLMYMLN